MTRPIHETLAAANERWIERAIPTADCPSGDTLWALCGGELPADEARALARHITTCGVCAEAVGLAKAMDRVPEVPATTHRRSWWPVPLALAAAALVVAMLLPRAPVHDGLFRGDDPGASVPTVMVRSAVDLEWPQGPRGSLYDLEVRDATLAVLYEIRGLERPSVRIPSERLATLSDGAAIHWRLTIRRPDGTRQVFPTRTVIIRAEHEGP